MKYYNGDRVKTIQPIYDGDTVVVPKGTRGTIRNESGFRSYIQLRFDGNIDEMCIDKGSVKMIETIRKST